MMKALQDLAAAFQFMTRLPLARLVYRPDALSRAARYFPLVGLAVGILSTAIYFALTPHLPAIVVALAIVVASTLVTGGLHEDGLADAADAFGGGWNREQILGIMRDSRIGSYGALAIVCSVGARVLLLAHLPAASFAPYAISAEVLSRWIVLPLSAALPAARSQESQGARIAGRISAVSLAVGTFLALGIAGYLLQFSLWEPLVAALAVGLVSGLYYMRRIGGLTGDCLGATVQITQIAVCLCGVWR